MTTAVRTFGGEREIEAAAQAWLSRIERMQAAFVVDWLTGVQPPPAAVRAEVDAQVAALLAAARAAGALPPEAVIRSIVSAHRGFAAQDALWRRKIAFEGPPFDRISDHARAVCGAALDPPHGPWRPAGPSHRRCWGAAPWAGEGGRPLTLAERQREILLASAPPGLSRHHWGSEVDLVAVESAAWEPGGPHAPLHAWLSGAGGAARAGFGQPFTERSGGYGRGPEAERWHWSYMPVADALLAFARAHATALERRLHSLWHGRPDLSVPAADWRTLLFGAAARG